MRTLKQYEPSRRLKAPSSPPRAISAKSYRASTALQHRAVRCQAQYPAAGWPWRRSLVAGLIETTTAALLTPNEQQTHAAEIRAAEAA